MKKYCGNYMVWMALLLILPLSCKTPGSEDFEFFAIGDMPYHLPEDYARLERMIAAINKEEPLFTIHVRDIKSGSTECSDEHFSFNQVMVQPTPELMEAFGVCWIFLTMLRNIQSADLRVFTHGYSNLSLPGLGYELGNFREVPESYNRIFKQIIRSSSKILKSVNNN